MRVNIINAASMLFAKNGACGVSIDDICIQANTDKNTINNMFGSVDKLYVEILKIGQDDFLGHNQSDMETQQNISPKLIIDELIEYVVSRMYEKENWPTKVFVRELLAPSNHLRNLMESSASIKLNSGLEAIENYTGLKKDDPLLLATLFNCFSPGLRLIALTCDDSYKPVKSLLLLPQKELCSYLKIFLFGGLDAIKSIALH
jgi:AcrR family transcriptional regulator